MKPGKRVAPGNSIVVTPFCRSCSPGAPLRLVILSPVLTIRGLSIIRPVFKSSRWAARMTVVLTGAVVGCCVSAGCARQKAAHRRAKQRNKILMGAAHYIGRACNCRNFALNHDIDPLLRKKTAG